MNSPKSVRFLFPPEVKTRRLTEPAVDFEFSPVVLDRNRRKSEYSADDSSSIRSKDFINVKFFLEIN